MHNPDVSTQEQLLTVEEAAEILAVKPRFVRHLIQTRRIHHVKVGHLVRIPRSGVQELIRSGWRSTRVDEGRRT